MSDTAWVDIIFGGVCVLLGMVGGFGISEAVRRSEDKRQ